ncbi:MAG TPA: tetratricopeptide repeat protein [Aestuariivirga sp.]|nr:tetratricopeptide repeat protein [Aestuariivirga sp.]
MTMTSKLALRPMGLTWLLILALGFSVAACSSPEERARAHYNSAMVLLKSGDFVKAGLEFRNALKFNEKLADAWAGLASVEEQKQNWPTVLNALTRVVELDAKNVDARIRLAKLQLAGNDLDLALKTINEANELKKDDTDVLALRAAILFRLNDREGARKEAERALSLNPDNPDAHAVLAADQMADGNMAAALRFLDRGLMKDPNNLGLLMFKLKIFEDTKDDAKLEAVLRQIVGANPTVKETRQALLGFLMSRKRFADAETELRAIVAADPTDTTRTLDLINFLTTTKGSAAARSELEKLIASKPDVVDYRLVLAKIDFSEKKSDVAAASLEAIIAKGEPTEDVVRAQILLANIYLQLGQTEKVKKLIGDVLARDAKNADALALRANLSLDSGELDSAVADLREALNQQPNSVALLKLLGRAHERQGAVELANDRLAQALKASNYAPQVAFDYIAFLSRRGKSGEAETVLNEAAARHPDDPGLLRALAQLRLSKQDWIGAQAAAEALKKIGDTSGTSEQIAGAALLGQKKYDEGIATLKSAQTAAPNSPQPIHSLVAAYVEAGKMSEAENFLKSILSANQNNAEAHALLGSLKFRQKLPKEAEASFKMAIERQPANPMGYVALAKLYLSQSQALEAKAVLNAGRAKVPNDLAINLLLAGLFELKYETEKAIAIYEEQLKATPDAVIVINNLASLLADYRTDPQSLERAHQLAQRLEAVDIPSFKDTVGWVAFRKGDYRNALLNLEQAAEKLPDIALIKYHLAMTYLALKRNSDAKDQLAKAEALLKGDDPLKEKIRVAFASLNASN